MFAFCVFSLLTTKLSIWFQTRERHRKQINALCPSFTSLRPIMFKLHMLLLMPMMITTTCSLTFYLCTDCKCDGIAAFNSRTNSNPPLAHDDDFCLQNQTTAPPSFSFKTIVIVILLISVCLLWNKPSSCTDCKCDG